MRISVPCTAVAALAAAALVSGANAQCPASSAGHLSHSVDEATVDDPNVVACGGSGLTTLNGFARCYNLGDEGTAGPITINNVTFGVTRMNFKGCVGDTDASGDIDVNDLVNVILLWGTDGQDPDNGVDADVNDDGIVSVEDLTAVILGWGVCQGEIDVSINIYLDSDGCASGANTPGIDAILAGSQTVTISPADEIPNGGSFIDVAFDPGIVVPEGCDVVLEIDDTEDGFVGTYEFRPAGNGVADGKGGCISGTPDCAPNLLRSAPCGLAGWGDLSASFPCEGMILSADYTVGGDGECDDPNPCGSPDAGPCCEANGTPGCDNGACCEIVCGLDDFCCSVEWDGQCANSADANCAPDVCADTPTCNLEIGTSGTDGYLLASVDELGSSADPSFDAISAGTMYNPAGPMGVSNPDFSFRTDYYDRTGQERQSLTRIGALLGVNDDDSMDIANIAQASCDGTTQVSSFDLVGNDTGRSYSVDLVQTIAAGAGAVRTLTQAYTFTDNNGSGDTTFSLYGMSDYDGLWSGDFGNDIVGTTWNGSSCDTYVYQHDAGVPEGSLTLSWDQNGDYVGSKGACDPGMGDPDCPPMGFGTDVQEFNAYGIPDCWRNFIALDGPGVNADSAENPCGGTPDGHIGVEIEVTCPSGGSVTVVFTRTYGAQTPGGAGCP